MNPTRPRINNKAIIEPINSAGLRVFVLGYFFFSTKNLIKKIKG